MGKQSKRILLLLIAAALLVITGCGSKVPQADMQKVWDSIRGEVQPAPMRALSEKRMMDRYGLDAAVLPQAIVMVSEDSLRVDEVWLIEAASETEARELAEAAENYIRQVCAETKDYSPEQYAVAEKGQVVTSGPYVGLFISPEADAMAEILEKALR